jgi:hypothetical protein
LHSLRKRGWAILAQVHDLAEDFRPEVYDSRSPYLEDVDYATINRRDRDNLIASGLDASHVHLLPNPVSSAEDFSPRRGFAIEAAKGRTAALYPVRAIRRKNVGETLLVSRFLPAGAEVAVTLPPTSPADLVCYRAWKARVGRGGWRVRFDAGTRNQLPELYDRSFCVLTTSVKEGFGYSYLDPLVLGLPVLGREIPHIVGDFLDVGLRFTGLYSEIRLSRDAVPGESLRASVARRLDSFRRSYSPAFGERGEEPLAPLLAGLARRFEAAFLDFGALDEELQGAILDRLESDAGFESELRSANPFLETLFEVAPGEAEARESRDIVLAEYSEREYGKRLAETYEIAIAREARGWIDKPMLLSRYLEPSAFFLSAS